MKEITGKRKMNQEEGTGGGGGKKVWREMWWFVIEVGDAITIASFLNIYIFFFNIY